MIEFKCHCSQNLQTPEDQAGGMMQCPRCGRLNDIPTLSDLRNLDAEGGFKISDLEIVDTPDRLKQAAKAFTRSRTTDTGGEIDLRPTLEDVMKAGVEEIPLTDDAAIGNSPKYDPITGELIVPLTVKREDASAETGPIPMATAVVGYATRDTQAGQGSVALALLSPVNLIVLFFVMLAYMLFALLTIFFAPIALILGCPPTLVGMVIVGPPVMAHYSNVINEVAFEERDELPRFMRNFSLSEDIWVPMVQFVLGVVYAFAPLAVWVKLAGVSRQGDALALGLLLLGSFVFPAALLTMTSSGSLPNARPDRLLSVIAAAGTRYLWLAVVSFIVVVTSMITIGGFGMIPVASLHDFYRLHIPPGWVAIPIVLSQLYLAHYGAWQLGLLYRSKHAQFKWVNQLHIKRNRTTLAPRRLARRTMPTSSVKSKP